MLHRSCLLSAVLVLVMPLFVVADDCVGWLRVQVPLNGIAAAAMPFGPVADGSVFAFLSGPFDESPASNSTDELIFVDGSSGTVSRVVWSSGAWRDLESGEEIDLSAGPSDAFVFRLQPFDPFDVFVVGRVPSSDALSSSLAPGPNLVSAGYPSLSFPTSSLPSGVSVEALWTGECVSGCLPWAAPVFVTNANPDAVVWTRARPYAALPPGSPRVRSMSVDSAGAFADFSVDVDGVEDVASFYLFADAARDTDGDGLSDALPDVFALSASSVEDGTRTRVLSPADFDEDGHCTIRFLKARGVTTSVCHRTAIFQNGVQIFTN